MNVNSEVEIAKTLIANKKYDEAENLLKNVIAFLDQQDSRSGRNIQLSEAYNSMGVILYKKVEFLRAISFYEKSIKSSSSFAPAYYNRGLIHYRLGSYDAAKADIQKAVTFEPENSEFSLGLQKVIDIMEETFPIPISVQTINSSNF